MKRQLLVHFVFALICSTAQAAGPRGNQPPLTGVESLIKSAPCNQDAECRTIAVGSNACGGPQRYLPWSTRTTTLQALQAAVDLRQGQDAPVLPGRDASVCILREDPGALCLRPGLASGESGRCELRGKTGSAGTLPALGPR